MRGRCGCLPDAVSGCSSLGARRAPAPLDDRAAQNLSAQPQLPGGTNPLCAVVGRGGGSLLCAGPPERFLDAVSGSVVRFGEALGLCWAVLGLLGWLWTAAGWAELALLDWAGLGWDKLGWSRQAGLLQIRGNGHSSSQSKSSKAENELETVTGLRRSEEKCGAQKFAPSRAKLKHQLSSPFSESAETLSSALPLPLLLPLPLPLSGLPSSAVGQCSLRWPGKPQ